MAPVWYHLGLAQNGLGRPDDAIASFRKALEVDPAYDSPYLHLGETLIAQGRRAEALRYWRHGAKFALQPESIVAALESAGE
jgi:tetratricopeptide (TPR) repeat protein